MDFEDRGSGFDLSPFYSPVIQQHDSVHWSPLPIIRKSVEFLCEKSDVKVLDIGSGSGKFCLSASLLRPDSMFHGVEQRKHLVEEANLVKELLERRNVEFLHRNFTAVNLLDYHGFYFYNAFFENLTESDRIDDTIDYSIDLYSYYSNYLRGQLNNMPSGTRIVTYCSWGDEIPRGYVLMENHFDGLLRFWAKS